MAVAAESSNSVLQALWSQSKQNDMDFWQGIPFPIDSFAVKNSIGRFSRKLDSGPNWRVLKAYQWRRRWACVMRVSFEGFSFKGNKGQQNMMM